MASEDFKQIRQEDRSTQLPTTPIQGCPSYEDLQKDDNTKDKCAYMWGYNNRHTYGDIGKVFGFNACKGSFYKIDLNHQWSASDCRGWLLKSDQNVMLISHRM